MAELIHENIYRILVPFKDVTTTVFVVKTPCGTAVIDTATYPADADGYIVPALVELGVEKPDYIILTHSHGDHAGGLARMHGLYPEAVIVSRSEKLHGEFVGAKWLNPTEGENILGVLEIIGMTGHSRDALGILDTRTKALITGDSLQLYGLFGSGKWGANIRFQREHLKVLDKLRSMDIERIFASHDYHTLGWRAEGKAAVAAYIDECEKALDDILNFLGAYQQLDDDTIADMYNSASGKPTVGAAVFTAARERL